MNGLLPGLLPMSLRINGERHDILAPPWRTLLEVLREIIGLTGTKRSCQEGQCGTCTVLIDGKAVNSCLYLAVEAQGKDIMTIEGVGKERSAPDPEVLRAKRRSSMRVLHAGTDPRYQVAARRQP